MLSGTVLVEGEITSSDKSEDVARLLSGTLAGDGTIDIPFSNIGGTLEPGGAGVIGELHFTSLSSQGPAGTLVLDIESGVAFDRLADLTSNFFLGGKLEIDLLGAYEPPVGTKWEFMSKGPGDPTEFTAIEPSAFTARSVPGGSEVELLTAPPTVLTQAAAPVAATSATLNGTVNPNAVRISACEFAYGTTVAYGSLAPCASLPGEGRSARGVSATVTSLTAGTTYHFRLIATNAGGTREGADETFTTPGIKGSEPPAEEVLSKEKPAEEKPASGGGSSGAGGSSAGGTTLTTLVGVPTAPGSEIPAAAIATTPRAVEEVLLGCTKSKLVLNDVYIRGGRVVLSGSAAKSLAGKQVKILINAGRQVASATVLADGQYATSAPLPLVKGRVAAGTRYAAQVGKLRSLNLKLTRRLQLEPPGVSGRTVTLAGQIELPLTKPIAAVVVEQQLKCGKTAIVKTFTPPASGRFDIALTVPAGATAGLFRLRSSVAANEHSIEHGFATYSLPLPAVLG